MTESWVDGFNKAVGSYLVANDGTWSLGKQGMTYSPLSKHITGECSLGDVDNVSQDIESEYVFDTFDSDRSYPTSYISAEISCACGKFSKVRVVREAVITDIIMGVTNAGL